MEEVTERVESIKVSVCAVVPVSVSFISHNLKLRRGAADQNDDSIPVRANKKKGIKSKKELREEASSGPFPPLVIAIWMFT